MIAPPRVPDRRAPLRGATAPPRRRAWALAMALLSGALGLGTPLQAQSEKEVFQTGFLLEMRLFEAASDRYVDARQRELDAWRQLEEGSERLDDALADAAVDVGELRELDRQVNTLRESAVARGREVAELRQQLFWSLDRIAELGVTIEELRDRSLVGTDSLDGLWRIEVDGTNEWGVLELSTDGTVVHGSYRLSNGGRGSLRGTYAGGVLSLERIDAERGLDMNMAGALDRSTGTLEGSWDRRELAGGEAAAGRWSARKITSDQAGALRP